MNAPEPTPVRRKPVQQLAKTAIDGVGALVGLVVLSPLLAAIAVWILLESGRPVLYVAPRAGLGGRAFRMYKFRSMVLDAVALGQELGLTDDPFGVLPDDPRITRSGRFLRRTSFDELPQLVNVLRGEMSLVGPRPDLIEQARHYTDADRRRLAVRPGITGWAQVRGRDEIPWPERIELDVWYAQNWSLLLDARIVLLTFAQVFRGEPQPIEDTMNIERARAAANGGPRLAEVDPADWDALVARAGCADAYLERAYVQSARLIEPGRPVFLHLASAGGDVLFPLILRPIPGTEGRTDVVTPYGYGGPVAAGDDPPLARFHELYEGWCAEKRAVSSFIRFHPLLGNHAYAAPGVRVERLGTSVAWRLDREPEEIAAGMHSHHRRVVRKARAAGIEVEATRAPDDLGDFAALYGETMARKGAADFYLFPEEYWSLLAALGERLVRLDARREGSLLASVLLLAREPWLHYHLGATSEEGRSLGASNLVQLEAALWGRAHGFTKLHLGGGVGGRKDSLFEFKRRFDPGGLVDVHVGKAIHDEEAYRALAGGAPGYDGFFPAYREARSPLPVSE